RNQSKIFDPLRNLLGTDRGDRAGHDLARLRQRPVAKVAHRFHLTVVTRRTSATEVMPALHLARPSSTMVVMPLRVAVLWRAPQSDGGSISGRTSSVISSPSNTPQRPR